MCGICGVVHLDGERRAERAALAAMNRQLVHRGSDDEGFFAEGNVGFAIRRLSIIDVRTGHQPLSNEDESVWIVYNGEIYNHLQLRADLEARWHRYRTRSDTETIVHLYEEYGQDCVKHLRGMFAFAIWDKRKRRLFAARDRLGIKPFYYRLAGGTFIFGSEIKAILAHPGVSAEFDRGALAEYLAFGYLTRPGTMYAGISKLMPGHTLELGPDGHINISQYWDLDVEADREVRTSEYYAKSYRDLLEQSVASHLMSDVPLGVFLSGGLDSGAVAALTAKIRGDRIKTFSVGYEETEFSELNFARQVADHIRSDHHEIRLDRTGFFDALPKMIWHEDEPIAWPSSISLFWVARLAREHVTVVLTGEGSDETLGGYSRYAWTLLNSRVDRIYRRFTPPSIRSRLRRGIKAAPLPATLYRQLEHTFLVRDGERWASFYFDNFYSAFSAAEQVEVVTPEALATAGDAYASPMQLWERTSGELLHRLLYSDIKSYLVELCMKQDQMSMAASIESRVPFLDHSLVEFSGRIPARYKVCGMAGKLILKEAVRDLLPQSVIHRKKMGFPTPWKSWLRGEQLNEIERLLLEPRSTDRNLFRPEAVKRLFFEHRARRRDHADRIWRLLNFEIWHRVCIEGERNFAGNFRESVVVTSRP